MGGWGVVDSGTTIPLHAVWGSGPTDVWTVGDKGTVLRWNGAIWAMVPSGTADALYRQAFCPVRWVECVRAIKARGVMHVVECGPGKVLAGMVKRIDPELTGAAVHDPASLAEVKGLLS